jgi:glycosyltransferase involved in cell wall biosynthesis
MRILHLSSLYAPFAVGGAERVVQMLAEGTAAHGVTVGVAHLAPQRMPTERRNFVDVYPLAHRNPLWIENSARHSGAVRKLNKVATLFNAWTAHDFAKVLDLYQPDIVHSHSMVELTPHMWKLAKARGAAVVHTLHDYDLMCIRAALFMGDQRCTRLHLACAAFSHVKRRYHGHIDHVVGVSRSILQTHLAHGFFGAVPQARQHVIWNPVQAAAPVGLRRREGPFTFGFLGRLVPEKGVGPLLDACRAMATAGWQLKIAGKAPKDDSFLRERMQGLPVELLGFVNPGEFLRSIDVLVVPSVWLEPFGLTIVEAYAAGVTVIGSSIAGVAEIIGSVDPGALFPPDDAAALARKMDGMVRLGRAGNKAPDCAAVLARTHPDQVFAQYLEVYRAAFNSRPGP